MPEANITSTMFEPQIFLSMVQQLEPSRGLTLYNSVRKDTTPFPFVQWTTSRGRFSELAEYNAPNAKANLIERQPSGTSTENAALAYIREGDYFTPSATLHLKDAEAGNEAAIAPAERLVAEQVQTVNDRINNRIEWSLWQAVQGGITYTGANTGSFNIDFGFRNDHKTTLGADDQWTNDDISVASIIETIRGTKNKIRRNGGVDVSEVWLTTATMDLLIEAMRKALLSNDSRWLISEAQINQYLQTGNIDGFMGVQSWKTLEQYYDVRNEDGQSVEVKPYIPHGTVLFMNRDANNALRYVTGPTADFDAPRGHIGRFAKNWTNPDPSGRQFLIEESGLPILDRPDQFATVKVASDTWINDQTWS